jgi:hypothetical protein
MYSGILNRCIIRRLLKKRLLKKRLLKKRLLKTRLLKTRLLREEPGWRQIVTPMRYRAGAYIYSGTAMPSTASVRASCRRT